MPPVILDHRLRFPDPRGADEDGLVAMGGDLSPARLLLAYRSGIFPWTVRPITWWSPESRGIFELDQVHLSRSVVRLLRKPLFEVTINRSFREVIAGCAESFPGRRSTWISPEFIVAYTELHQAGHAHSVECWQQGRLVGGIYGVAVGGLFAGESMFHRVSNASKIALLSLLERLRNRGFALFDVQMVTDATAAFGAVEIPRDIYLSRLAQAVCKEVSFS
jgi:leucyl/phenylalanyl-tRNA--protein transferase